MEDFYYFPSSLETSEIVHRGFLPVVHSSPRNRSSPSPRPRRGSRDDAGELGHHYLDACFRCGRTIAGNKDIFMYRRHPVLQRGVPAAADRHRRGGGEEIQEVRGRDDDGAAVAAAEPAQSARLGSVEASMDQMAYCARHSSVHIGFRIVDVCGPT
uniref:FLZ-type domain-containing protein n=1 Tax=Triticum urartu TaxID=4572 RepID=A0A8R7QQ05_TRIUA